VSGLLSEQAVAFLSGRSLEEQRTRASASHAADDAIDRGRVVDVLKRSGRLCRRICDKDEMS